MPHLEAQQRAMAINRLLSLGQLDLLRNSSGLLYRMKDAQTASKMKGSDNQEKLVYQVIEDAGNKGIWSRDIRYKSNLPLTEINKILKNLESKKLIKAVKSVAASKKKVYMLYNLQPDRSVTGGAWYSDQDFESEFVEVLNQQCFKFLQSKVRAPLNGIIRHQPYARCPRFASTVQCSLFHPAALAGLQEVSSQDRLCRFGDQDLQCASAFMSIRCLLHAPGLL
uniref:DNA-directed RNA polymerase III subunit RPC6-like n=1 Tax=Oncorhynchus gorbuscha TaxID=8017 RepID=UPI001EAF576A|nr:DNA-directed RNA polymerase III subunit RPC6-like [Oncorhynchus gorbuscha]